MSHKAATSLQGGPFPHARRLCLDQSGDRGFRGGRTCTRGRSRNTCTGIRGFCQGQIAHYKVPRYVHFVEPFPTTVTGKVQKYLMREQMMQLLNLSEQRTV